MVFSSKISNPNIYNSPSTEACEAGRRCDATFLLWYIRWLMGGGFFYQFKWITGPKECIHKLWASEFVNLWIPINTTHLWNPFDPWGIPRWSEWNQNQYEKRKTVIDHWFPVLTAWAKLLQQICAQERRTTLFTIKAQVPGLQETGGILLPIQTMHYYRGNP